MAIFLNLLRNPYVIGVIGVLLVGGIQQARVMRSHYLHAEVVSELAQQRAEWSEASRAGHKAAQAALQAAILRERETAAARVSAEQEAAQRLAETAREAERRAADWRRRYREAAANDPSCAAWRAEEVQCPTD